MEGALINRCKQSRKVNPSARREQLDRIRKADSGHTGDVFSASRCFVTKRNSTPGYRGSREAGRMDCHQKVQNGHRVLYGHRCAGSGHSLMSLMVCVFLALVFILPVCNGDDPCTLVEEVKDEWRDLSSQGQKTDHCDQNRFIPDKWYSFHLRGKPAWIPVQCVKSNMCGASVGMRVDLLGQPLPLAGQNITAALCGAYDVLGKYDCCVLRTTVYIARCADDDRLVYSFPTPVDRCPVSVCTQGEIQVPPAVFAKMGDDVSKSNDSSVTDIPDTTTDGTDSTTAASTPVKEIVSDTTPEPEESTESPAPPQPFIQLTTDSETTTSDIELSTEAVTAETTPILLSTDTSSNANVESQDTDASTTDQGQDTDASTMDQGQDTDASTTDQSQVSDSVTESSNDSDTSSALVYEIHTLTNPSSDSHDETTEVTTAAIPDQTSAEDDSTETAIPPDANQETTSDITSGLSSDVNLMSATDISTTEQSVASVTETQTTTQSIADEDLSSTIQSLLDEDRGRSNDSDDEPTTSTSLDLSTTASTVPSSSEIYEPVSKSAEEEEEEATSSTPKSAVTDTTIAETTDNTPTTESLLDTMETTNKLTKRIDKVLESGTTTEGVDVTTIKGTDVTMEEERSTKLIQKLPESRTTTEGITVTTIKGTDVKMEEVLRFVFQGTPQSVYPIDKVHNLLDKFLKKAKGNSDWSYELFNGTEAVNYQNMSTYMDFNIIRRGNDVKDGTTFFEEHQLSDFIAENSNMTLINLCRASKNCQEEINSPTVLASVFEKNAPAFTAVIVLCVICLLILVVVALYWRFSKRGSWKAPDPEPIASPENRRHDNGNQSPFTDEQIMKDEMVDNASASYGGSAKDVDTNLSGTWVIPLDQDTGNQQTSVSITTEDTKF